MKKYCAYCGNRIGIRFASEIYIIAQLIGRKIYCSHCGAIKKEAVEFMKAYKAIIRPSRNYYWDVIFINPREPDPRIKELLMGKGKTYWKAAEQAMKFVEIYKVQYEGPTNEEQATRIEKAILLDFYNKKEPTMVSFMRGYGMHRLEDLGIDVEPWPQEEVPIEEQRKWQKEDQAREEKQREQERQEKEDIQEMEEMFQIRRKSNMKKYCSHCGVRK